MSTKNHDVLYDAEVPYYDHDARIDYFLWTILLSFVVKNASVVL